MVQCIKFVKFEHKYKIWVSVIVLTIKNLCFIYKIFVNLYTGCFLI